MKKINKTQLFLNLERNREREREKQSNFVNITVNKIFKIVNN